MKRRHFLAAAAALLAGETLAAPVKKAVPATKKGATKVTGKAAAKPGLRGKPGKTLLKPGLHAPTAGSPALGLREPRGPALRLSDPPTIPWRPFELTVEANPINQDGPHTLWLPLPLEHDSGWQRGHELQWSGNFNRAAIVRDGTTDAALFRAEWNGGSYTRPNAQIVCRFSVRDRQFDVTRRGLGGEPDEVLRRFLRPTPDNALRDLAERIVGRIREPLPQARAIYDWLLENSGDSEQQHLRAAIGDSGESLAPLFAALCRGLDIPARVAPGLRLDTRQPHLRAEFYAPFYGWMPVDPDSANGIHNDLLRKRFFGFWDMSNWLAYSRGGDLQRLPSNLATPYLASAWTETQGKAIADLPLKISIKAIDL